MILHILQNLNNLVINTIQIKIADRVFTPTSQRHPPTGGAVVCGREDGWTCLIIRHFHYLRAIMKKMLRFLFLAALLFTVAGLAAVSCQKGGAEEDNEDGIVLGSVGGKPHINPAVQERSRAIQSDPELVRAVYDLIKSKPSISRAELAKTLNTSERQVRKAIDSLRGKRIRRKGGDSGEWKALK